MIYIISDEGTLFNVEDSKEYIKWKMKSEFSDLEQFKKCKEILYPTYWGEYILINTEYDYSVWVNEIAKLILI